MSLLAGPYGHPLHPVLVTVPIGAWVASFVAPVAAGGQASARPPEQHFPVPVVVLHGLLAATTLVLVLLAALGAS